MNSFFKPFAAAVFVLLVFAMLTSCENVTDINLPEGSSDSGGLIWRVESGEAVVIGYNGNDTDITVPETYQGYPVTSINAKAFRGKTYIENVSLPDSIKNIGTEAFSGCTALQSVNIPSDLIRIEGRTFFDCQSLSSITIPKSVLAIDSGAFFRCTALTSVYYEGTLEMWLAILFSDYEYRADANPCNNGADLYISGSLLTDLVLPAEYEEVPVRTFSGCKSIETVYVPKTVTKIGKYAFYKCSSLKIVKYEGTKNEWKEVYIDNKNSPIRKADVLYKSKLQ